MFTLLLRCEPKNHRQAKVLVEIAHSLVSLLIVGGLIVWTSCAGIGEVNSPYPSSDRINISISPASATVKAGESMQFSAQVTGTSQTGVTWFASAGVISANGLLQAPSASVTNLTVTATSAADNHKRATASVDVTPPVRKPIISTTSLMPATVGVAYSATWAATGGEPPYRWNVISGALPLGLQLSTTAGTLSGTPTVAGASSFVVGLSDKNGGTAQQSSSLLVASALICGPPSYPCSRSDFDIVIPTAPPQLGSDRRYYGGHSGAGMVAIDPDYGNRILRVTDGSIDTAAPGMAYGTSWSAEANLISSDESLFFVTNEGSTPCLFQFDSAAFQAIFHGCRYHIGAGNLQFGYTQADAQAFYNYSGPYLYRFVIDRNTWGISYDKAFNQGQGYFDPDGPQCLSGKLAAEKQWYVQDTSLSSDDSTFIAEMGPEQDVDPYVVVWNAVKGCRWMNVKTWEVSQGWNTGLANPAKISWVSGTAPTSPGGMHNVQLDRSGQFAVLAINGTSLASKVFWDINTNVVNDACPQCQSHWACDFGVCFWSFGSPGQSPLMRDLSILPSTDMSSMMGHPDFPVNPSISSLETDEHAAHQNASTSRKNIYLVEESWDSGAFTVTGIWENELIGVNWDGSKRTVRFNKTWSSAFAGCPISRLGHYAICSSDYQMYNLDKGFGSGLNQDTCDHNIVSGGRGTNACRRDVLLFELR